MPPLLRRRIGQQLALRHLRLASNYSTREIASRWGGQLGFVYVCGYPKSGTTWVSQMVASYLGLPTPEGIVLPIGFKSVVHQHWEHRPAFDRAIYVIRDGRDVMVSLYMNLMKNYVARKARLAEWGRLSLVERGLLEHIDWSWRHARRFERILGSDFDPWDTRANLHRFIDAEMDEPFLPIVRVPWQEHVSSWRRLGKETVFVRYEDLLADTRAALTAVFTRHLGTEPDAELVDLAVRRCAFERQTGRRRGTEDRTKFARKGMAGDWKNHFTAEARRVFQRRAGELLIAVGYETDDSWARQAA